MNLRRIIVRVYQAYSGKTTFNYRFIGHRAMAKASFVERFHGSHDDDDHPTATTESYTYPFSTLPTIKLHIPPHHVIYNTGRKLDNHIRNGEKITPKSAEELYRAGEASAHLNTVLELYRAWMSIEVPPSFINDRLRLPAQSRAASGSQR